MAFSYDLMRLRAFHLNVKSNELAKHNEPLLINCSTLSEAKKPKSNETSVWAQKAAPVAAVRSALKSALLMSIFGSASKITKVSIKRSIE